MRSKPSAYANLRPGGELGGKIQLHKLNVDKHPQLAQQFGVRSIPHYILFKKGKILWRKGGIMTKRDLLQ